MSLSCYNGKPGTSTRGTPAVHGIASGTAGVLSVFLLRPEIHECPMSEVKGGKPVTSCPFLGRVMRLFIGGRLRGWEESMVK